MRTETKETFAEWMLRVDAVLVRRTGMTHEDLPDVCYAEMYEDGLRAGQAAAAAIRYLKGGEA